jgi:hypothetical protein
MLIQQKVESELQLSDCMTNQGSGDLSKVGRAMEECRLNYCTAKKYTGDLTCLGMRFHQLKLFASKKQKNIEQNSKYLQIPHVYFQDYCSRSKCNLKKRNY